MGPSHCAAEARIIAFVTNLASIRAILGHIEEPMHPPRLAPARDPSARAGDNHAGEVIDSAGESAGLDPPAQPEPEYSFDQRILWSKAYRGVDGTGLPSAGAAPSLGAQKRTLKVTARVESPSPGKTRRSGRDRSRVDPLDSWGQCLERGGWISCPSKAVVISDGTTTGRTRAPHRPLGRVTTRDRSAMIACGNR